MATAPSTPFKAAPLWLRPGVRVLQRMGMAYKLVGLGLMLILPMLVVTVLLFQSLLDERNALRHEAAGVGLVHSLIEVAALVQTHRGQTHMVLSGNAEAEPALAQTKQQLQAALGASRALFQRHARFQLQEGWAPIERDLSTLITQRHAPEHRAAVFARHSAQVAALQQLAQRSGQATGLVFSSVPVHYFLTDIVVEKMIPLTEITGIMRGDGAGQLARQEAIAADAQRVVGTARSLQVQLSHLGERVEALGRAGESPPASWSQAAQESRAFAELADSLFKEGGPQGDARAFFDAGTRAIQAQLVFGRAAAQRLETLLHEQAHATERMIALVASVGAALLALLVYVMLCFYTVTLRNLQALSSVLDRATEGDLTADASVAGSDEMADIGRKFQLMLTGLSELVADVRSAAAVLGHVGRELVDDSQALSDRTQSQAASLEETTANVRHVADIVAGNADSAVQVSQVTGKLQQETERAGSLMHDTIGGMATLEGTSKRMNEIIGAIDSIAFQTNILALNAAVEAARAGCRVGASPWWRPKSAVWRSAARPPRARYERSSPSPTGGCSNRCRKSTRSTRP